MRNSFNEPLKQDAATARSSRHWRIVAFFTSVYWTGGGGEPDWSNRFNWSASRLPGNPQDTVTINGNSPSATRPQMRRYSRCSSVPAVPPNSPSAMPNGCNVAPPR